MTSVQVSEPNDSRGRLVTANNAATPVLPLVLGFGAIIVLISVLMVTWFSAVTVLSEDIKSVAARHSAKTELLTSMRDIARSRAVILHRMVVLDDTFDRDAAYVQFMAQADRFVRVRDSYLNFPLSDPEQNAWDDYKRSVSIAQRLQEGVVERIQSGQIASARTMLLRDVIPVQDEMMVKLTHIADAERDASQDALEQEQIQFDHVRDIIVVLGLFALAASTLISIYVVRRARLSESTLLTATRAAQDASNLKSEFLARVSHELRTPLNAVIGYSELLMDAVNENRHPGYIIDLEKIRDSGKHLLGLIDDVLDLSKIESGKFELHIEEVQIPKLLDDVVAVVRPLASANETVIDLVNDRVGTIQSDAKCLRQILLNLLANACKFTLRGTVSIKASTRDGAAGPEVVFQITDTGIGMSAAQVRRLFQPFVQGDAEINRRFGGTGLGLAISRGLCQTLGGDIDVESAEGAGTAFTVHLPLRRGGGSTVIPLHAERARRAAG